MSQTRLTSDYYNAFAAVRAGTAGPRELQLTNDAAKQAGQMGSDARAALEAAKRK